MTNNIITFLTSIDIDAECTNDHLDDMLDFLYPTIIITSIDYYLDDCHADPESYLPSSPTFCARNQYNNPSDYADIDFYDKYNDNQFILTYRMLLESIDAELHDAPIDDDIEYDADEIASMRAALAQFITPASAN